jgi:hypothetical protein
MARRYQFCTQLLEIVNLSVEDHPNGFVFIGDRLLSGRKVNYAQPPMPQEKPTVAEEAPVVRSPMLKDIRRIWKFVFFKVEIATKTENPKDATHIYIPFLFSSRPKNAVTQQSLIETIIPADPDYRITASRFLDPSLTSGLAPLLSEILTASVC